MFALVDKTTKHIFVFHPRITKLLLEFHFQIDKSELQTTKRRFMKTEVKIRLIKNSYFKLSSTTPILLSWSFPDGDTGHTRCVDMCRGPGQWRGPGRGPGPGTRGLWPGGAQALHPAPHSRPGQARPGLRHHRARPQQSVQVNRLQLIMSHSMITDCL